MKSEGGFFMEETIKNRDVLIALSLIRQGDTKAMLRDLHCHTGVDLDAGLEMKKKLRCKCVTVFDEDFPASISRVPYAPLVLYYQGNLDLIRQEEKCVAIVGAREATTYGSKHASILARELSQKDYVIVSGLARGIDAAALQEALPHGKAVAVLGYGFHHVYPSENRLLQKQIGARGLLLSEYPPDVPPSAEHFPARNRLIAGLSQLTIVAEAARRSGSLITATFALNMGKYVGAIPYPLSDAEEEASGCNALIKDGAFLIEETRDVEEILAKGGTYHFKNSL